MKAWPLRRRNPDLYRLIGRALVHGDFTEVETELRRLFGLGDEDDVEEAIERFRQRGARRGSAS